MPLTLTGLKGIGVKYIGFKVFDTRKFSENLNSPSNVDWLHCIAVHRKKTKLWCNGPAYIAGLYREELKKFGYQI